MTRWREDVMAILIKRITELTDQLEAGRPRKRGGWRGSYTAAEAEAWIAAWRERRRLPQVLNGQEIGEQR
jgi:hypothetical protein